MQMHFEAGNFGLLRSICFVFQDRARKSYGETWRLAAAFFASGDGRVAGEVGMQSLAARTADQPPPRRTESIGASGVGRSRV